MIARVGDENLGFMLQPPERAGVDYPVPIVLERRPVVVFLALGVRFGSPRRPAGELGVWFGDLPFYLD